MHLPPPHLLTAQNECGVGIFILRLSIKAVEKDAWLVVIFMLFHNLRTNGANFIDIQGIFFNEQRKIYNNYLVFLA